MCVCDGDCVCVCDGDCVYACESDRERERERLGVCVFVPRGKVPKIFLHFKYDTYISQQFVHSVTSHNTHYYITLPNVQSHVQDSQNCHMYHTQYFIMYSQVQESYIPCTVLQKHCIVLFEQSNTHVCIILQHIPALC